MGSQRSSTFLVLTFCDNCVVQLIARFPFQLSLSKKAIALPSSSQMEQTSLPSHVCSLQGLEAALLPLFYEREQLADTSLGFFCGSSAFLF